MRTKMLFSIILFLSIFQCYCKNDKSTNPNEPVDTIKKISGYTAYTMIQVEQKIFDSAQTMPPSAEYVNGWWSYSIQLPNGQKVDVKIQFQDQSGSVQKNYNPQTTYTILGKGKVTGVDDTMDYDFVLTGTNNPYNTVTFNGIASVLYKGTSATINANNVKIPKSLTAYPSQGTITIITMGTTVTITFNGTRYAQGTFTYAGTTYSFTIDLETGQIS